MDKKVHVCCSVFYLSVKYSLCSVRLPAFCCPVFSQRGGSFIACVLPTGRVLERGTENTFIELAAPFSFPLDFPRPKTDIRYFFEFTQICPELRGGSNALFLDLDAWSDKHSPRCFLELWLTFLTAGAHVLDKKRNQGCT